MINKQSKKITGGVLVGLLTGILIGYFIGINQSKNDDRFLSQWVKDCGEYEDGNVFGYETGLPDNYHEKQKREKEAKPNRKKQLQK
ncbi:MAG: hypothetical protein M3R72_05580 [Bacteroidota bacterium]|nr:hypothetical protein [Bacteroidota bacterium]